MMTTRKPVGIVLVLLLVAAAPDHLVACHLRD